MNADKLFPIEGFTNTVFLKPLIENSDVTNVIAGDYSYYSDFEDPTQFFKKNVLYNYGFSGAKLNIGKFCAFAHGTSFMMPDANHAMTGVSTYPFSIFGGAWAEKMAIADYPFPQRSDTHVGNDVWIGMDAIIMPGVTIGDGAIIGTKSVVSADVPAYSVVAGNPAKVVKRRFDDRTIAQLHALAWWDWPLDHITQMVPKLVKGTIDDVVAYAREQGLA